MKRLRLTLDVQYVPNGTSVKELADNLRQMVHLAMGEGLITGNSPAEVSEHSVKIEQIQDV